MAARNYTVTDTVLPVFPDGAQDTLTVYNTSATDVLYVNEHPDLNGFALGAGSTMTWDAKRALYLYAPTGKTIIAAILDNAGTIFPAGAIASQILQQGLATQIANAITLNGVPPIDPYTTILSASVPFVGGGGDYFSAFIDCHTYQSLIISVKDTRASSAATPTPRTWTVYWYDKDPALGGALIIGYESFESCDNNNVAGGANEMIFTCPTRGHHMAVLGSDSGLTSTASLRVVGSYKSVEKPSYVMRTQWAGSAGAVNASPFPASVDRFYYSAAAPKAAGLLQDWPHVIGGGFATATVTASNVTVAGSVAIADVKGGSAVGSGEPIHAYFALPINAGIQSQTVMFAVPNRALLINWSAALVATYARVTIAYEG